MTTQLRMKSPFVALGALLGIPTPAPILRTHIGNPAFTTPDQLDEFSSSFFGQLDISDLIEKPFKQTPIAKLFQPHRHVKLILSGRSIAGGQNVGCDAGGLKVDTHTGRKRVTADKYLERINIDNPGIVVALADEVDMNIGNKRISKAIERTKNWYHELSAADLCWKKTTGNSEALSDADTNTGKYLFAVIQQNPNYPEQLPTLIDYVLSNGAAGIVLGGAHMNETAKQRGKFIKSAKEHIPAHVPTMIQGADSIEDIALALAHGVDLISGNYPHTLARKGHASALPASLIAQRSGDDAKNAASTTTADAAAGGILGSGSMPATVGFKRLATDDTDEVAESQSTDVSSAASKKAKRDVNVDTTITSSAADNCSVNLWSTIYKKDTRPLVEGCQCHACKHHTRAYIHHLLLSKEMLAELLLFHHNQHQLLQLFDTARSRIGSGTFDSWSAQLCRSSSAAGVEPLPN